MRIYHVIIVSILSLCAGCAAPGSSGGLIAISGSIERPESETPLFLKAILPKEYGFSNLDLALSNPEDFGHLDQTVRIDVEGSEFTYTFPRVIYSALIWYIPPLGPDPKHPPPPWFYFAFSDAPNETYLIGMLRGEFKYRVFDKTIRQEIDASQASWKLGNAEYVPIPDHNDVEVWHLRFHADKVHEGQEESPSGS